MSVRQRLTLFPWNYSELTSLQINYMYFFPTFFRKTFIFDSLDYYRIIFIKKLPFGLSESLNGLKILLLRKCSEV